MKKILILIYVFITAVFLVSCNNFKTTDLSDEKNITCDEKESAPSFKYGNCNDIIAILPDTQIYTTNNQLKEIFFSQMEWIVNYEEEYRIKFTVHLGDIVNEPQSVPMWNIADEAFQILDDANIPYGVTAGNHDFHGTEGFNWYGWDDNSRSPREKYLKYFSKERTSQVTKNYGGHSDNGWNSYYFFNASGREYLALFIDYVASEDTFNWAKKILKEHKDTPAIVFTHVLTRVRNSHEAFIEEKGAEIFWEKLIYENDQIFLAVNGHYAGAGYEIRQNKFGNDVFLIVVDYQADKRGGNGWMRLIEFDEKNNRLRNFSFSPYLLNLPSKERDYDDVVELIDKGNKFSFNLNYEERFNFKNK